MTQYRRSQRKPLALDTPEVRAAVNLVLAVEVGEVPGEDTLRVLRDAFLDLFEGADPVAMFGKPLGFVSRKGRPKHYGFTPADIVSSFIELRRRELEVTHPTNALETAKKDAAAAFVDFSGAADAERSVDRDWADGRAVAESLDDDELRDLIAPYALADK